jgi:hypothetical protein
MKKKTSDAERKLEQIKELVMKDPDGIDPRYILCRKILKIINSGETK